MKPTYDCADLFKVKMNHIDSVLKDAGIKKSEVYEIFLVSLVKDNHKLGAFDLTGIPPA